MKYLSIVVNYFVFLMIVLAKGGSNAEAATTKPARESSVNSLCVQHLSINLGGT